jgi:large subunit ribosomal protein L18
MNKNAMKTVRRTRRRIGLRKRIQGTQERPRLAVFKSLHHIYAQVINDLEGKTLASASTVDKEIKTDKGGNSTAAKAVGKLLAQRATKAGVSAVVFDRGGFKFHGRVKALADAAREGGLKF